MRNIIIAFPGTGKTPACRWINNCIDLDFGMFRNALGVKKEEESKILLPFAKLVISYVEENWNVMTNEPSLIPTILAIRPKLQKEINLFVPSDSKGFKYCANKMKVSEDQIKEWVSDWIGIARKHGVKIIPLNTGLDYYLKGLNRNFAKIPFTPI